MVRVRIPRLSRSCAALLLAGAFGWVSAPSDATVVRLDTDLGEIDLTLYDGLAPATVANFLNYVESGRYDGTFFHRSIAGFVVQGGGFSYDVDANDSENVETDDPVVNEFGLSNTVGTVAMAKLGGDPDSATSQWFFNVGNNGSNLDNQNGGFTVFAQVSAAGLEIVNQIAALPTADLDGNFSQTFDTVPLEGVGGDPLGQSLVFVNSASVVDLVEGDANQDGFIGQADLDAVLLNWDQNNSTWDTGDFDGNAVNGQNDLDSAVLPNWGLLAEPSAVSGSAVPEPATLGLMALAGLAGMCRRRP